MLLFQILRFSEYENYPTLKARLKFQKWRDRLDVKAPH